MKLPKHYIICIVYIHDWSSNWKITTTCGSRAGPVLTREADGEHTEVPLQARVDGEATGGGVHARHVLRVVDLLRDQLLTVVPVTVDMNACVHNKGVM